MATHSDSNIRGRGGGLSSLDASDRGDDLRVGRGVEKDGVDDWDEGDEQ